LKVFVFYLKRRLVNFCAINIGCNARAVKACFGVELRAMFNVLGKLNCCENLTDSFIAFFEVRRYALAVLGVDKIDNFFKNMSMALVNKLRAVVEVE